MSVPEFEEGAGGLSRIQQWFQAVITHADGVETGVSSEEAQRLIRMPPDQLERVVTRSRALTATERLAIYANAYHSRLLECLGEVFPILKRTLGDEGFDALAFGYLQVYPSRSYTLNELGRHFPRFLEQTRPETNCREDESSGSDPCEQDSNLEKDWPDFLIDLVRLEWAIYEVFDGPGVEGKVLLQAEQLRGISAEQWPCMRLVPVVCLRLLKTRFPVNDYFTALRRAPGGEVVPMPSPGSFYIALTRREFVVRRYSLSEAEFELLTTLKDGCSIDQAVKSILPKNGTDLAELAASLQMWFRNWTAEGFFQSVEPAAGACARPPQANES